MTMSEAIEEVLTLGPGQCRGTPLGAGPHAPDLADDYHCLYSSACVMAR